MNSGGRVADFLSRVAVLVILLIGLTGVFGWYLPLIKHNQALRKEIAQQKQLITRLTDDIQSKQRQLRSYKHDARSAERLARETLRYSREGETIFHFEAPQEKPRMLEENTRRR